MKVADPIKNYITLLRPYQWPKNLLVFAGLIFSESVSKIEYLTTSFLSFIAFCIISSGVYILNDLLDIKQDKLHPIKRNRPLASGKVSTKVALLLILLLFSGGIALSYYLERKFGNLVLTYIFVNIAYSLGLKKIALVDVMIVSSGFLIRAMAGCKVINVITSPWLFLCTLFFALAVSFGKRRHELTLLDNLASGHRASLSDYSTHLLDIIIGIASSAFIVTYSLYTMAPETVAHFGHHRLVYTVPFVTFGVFRYLFIVYQKRDGGDPSKIIATDIQSLINGILWAILVIMIIYGDFRLF